MIYKNCILGKKLSGLDIYISIFCLLLLSLLEVFLLLLLIPLPVWFFFVNYGDLLMQIVIFVFSLLYYFYFNLVGINQKYMLLTYLLVTYFIL